MNGEGNIILIEVQQLLDHTYTFGKTKVTSHGINGSSQWDLDSIRSHQGQLAYS